MNPIIEAFVEDMEGSAGTAMVATNMLYDNRKRKLEDGGVADAFEGHGGGGEGVGDGEKALPHLRGGGGDGSERREEVDARKATGGLMTMSSKEEEEENEEEDESSASSSPASGSPDTDRALMDEEDEQGTTMKKHEDGEDDAGEPRSSENVADESSSSSSSSSKLSAPPSPPPVPRHRHQPSAGAQRTFENLAAADAPSTTTHRSTVIAAVVVFDGEGRVLLVQEAKASCRGKWYLPAGRVEVGESPIEGAMREMEEETGLQLEPSGIFSVEYKINKSTGKAWIRYGITGQIVGGSLKTPDREDKESIQAKWFPLAEVRSSLPRRSDDMLKVIDLYERYGDRPVPVLGSYK